MVVKVVKPAPPAAALLVVVDVDVIEAGPELVGGGEDTVLLPPLDWKEALRLTLGEGRSEPASLELVVWLEELRDSTLQDDISNDRGLEVFIRTLLSNVDTLKRRTLLLQDFLHELPTFAGKWCATSMLLKNFNNFGGFQLVDLIIKELKKHMTC